MITRIYFLLVYSGMLLSSCINISENEKRRLDYLKISLENSTKAVSYGIIKTYSEFESKKNDPDYSNQAEKQADHFKVIQTESESINQYIDSLITISGWKGTDLESLFSEKYVTGFLYEKLKRYETVVFKLDTNLKKVFQ